MTIERLGQLTAETRITSDIDTITGSFSPSISTDKVRTGNYSYEGNSNPVLFGFVVGSPTTAYRFGYWINHRGIGDESRMTCVYMAAVGKSNFESPSMVVFLDAINSTMDLVIPQSGTTNAWNELASVPIPSELWQINTWIHVGVSHKIHDTTGFISVYINEVEALNYTGDTRLFGQNGGSNTFSTTATYIWGAGNIEVGSGGWENFQLHIDDMYLDSYVGESDAIVPAKRFLLALPDGAGADSEWTGVGSATNYENVDDNPNDGDDTYNQATSAGLKDTYTFSDIVVPDDHQIVAAIPFVYARRLAAGPELRLVAYDGANTANGSDQAPDMDYIPATFERMEEQPDATAWNETDFNAMQFGVESRGTFT